MSLKSPEDFFLKNIGLRCPRDEVGYITPFFEEIVKCDNFYLGRRNFPWVLGDLGQREEKINFYPFNNFQNGWVWCDELPVGVKKLTLPPTLGVSGKLRKFVNKLLFVGRSSFLHTSKILFSIPILDKGKKSVCEGYLFKFGGGRDFFCSSTIAFLTSIASFR